MSGTATTLILTVYDGDLEMCRQMLDPLLSTRDSQMFRLLVADGGMEEQNWDWWVRECRAAELRRDAGGRMWLSCHRNDRLEIYERLYNDDLFYIKITQCNKLAPFDDSNDLSFATASLSHALNEAIRVAMWLDGRGVRGDRDDSRPGSYIGWIHPDMSYEHDKTWLSALESELQEHPDWGKLSPNADINRRGDPTRPGNQCPWLMPKHVLVKLMDRDGYYFDPQYRGIGGYEDWDINKRILDMGYKVMITDKAFVAHQGMGTRGKRDTRGDAAMNYKRFVAKWGSTCPV